MRAGLLWAGLLLLALAPHGLGATIHVHIQGFQYRAAEIHIKSGDNVTWDNHDDALHTVTSEGARFASSPALAKDGLHTAAFPTPGTYAYSCEFHPYMTGTVVVSHAPPPNRPPTLTFDAPAPGAVLRGRTTLSGTASDPDNEPVAVDIRIDNGNWIRVGGSAAWSYSWDTTSAANGTHFLRARASDGRSVTESAVRNVTVANPGAPAPTPRMVLSDLKAPIEARVGGEIEVTALLGNDGTARGSATVRFFLDSVQRAVQSATVDPGASTQVTVRLTMEETGTHALTAAIEGHAPLGPRLVAVDPAVTDDPAFRSPAPARPNRIPWEAALGAALAVGAAWIRRRD